MKQAKWLLLMAVGILVMLPGCKQMNPVVNPDVRVAVVDLTIGTWPIMANSAPQTQIGTATFYWEYDHFDPSLPPGPNGNGQFVDLKFGVKYETYSGYPISYAHLNISTVQPTGKGSPGLYNFNSYLQTSLPSYTAIFLIPETTLMAVPDSGWDCGDYLWFLCEVSSGGISGMVGDFHNPEQGAWWNDLYTQITNPAPPDNPEPPEYREETAWGYNIADQSHWFWALGRTYKWGGVMPYTLGRSPATFDLWAGAGQNDPSKGKIVGTVTITDNVTGGVGQVFVHYVLTDGCLASEAHAGADKDLASLSKKSNKFAPGKLGVNGYYSPWDDDFTLALDYNPDWTNSFVVAAHAIVEIPVPTAPTSQQTTGE
jgi:hypothetical protein